MMQAAQQIRNSYETARAALRWLRAHASLVMGATLLVVAAVWLAEHDARLRREAELRQTRQNITQEVSTLRQQADIALKDSRANERVIRDMESRRTALEREASVLRAQLSSLRKEERARVRPAITPGHIELAGATEPPPDLARFEIRNSEFGVRGSESREDTGNSKLETRAARETNAQTSEALDRAGNLLVSNFQFPVSISSAPNPSLDTCRGQVSVQDKLITNCEERAELNRAALEAAKRSALDLNEALRAKDQMAARIEERHHAELELARGSRLRRFGRALQYVGVGVVIGIAIAQ